MGREYTRKISVFDNVPSVSKILYYSNFELDPKVSEGGTGSPSIRRDIGKFMMQPASMKVFTQPTTPLANDDAYIAKELRLSTSGKVYVMLMIRFKNDNGSGYIDFEIKWYNGTTLKRAKIRYDLGNAKLQYYGSGGAYVDVVGGACSLPTEAFFMIKYGFDMENGKYEYVEAQDQRIDMTDVEMKSDASAVAKSAEWTIRITNEEAWEVSQLYVDRILITDEEV